MKDHIAAYKRPRNLYVKFLRKSKKYFYNNVNVKKIIDDRTFWRNIKPNFTDKTLKDEIITFVDEDKLITEEKDVVEKFKNLLEKL